MKSGKQTEPTLTLRLSKSTSEAIDHLAAACDLTPSGIVEAFLSEHVPDMKSMSALAKRMRGTSGSSLDETCDLVAHLWMHEAIALSTLANEGFPWASTDEGLRTQWADDLALFDLRKKVSSMKQHEAKE